MPLNSKNTFPAALAATGALFVGATPALAGTAHNHNVAQAVQRDINRLARRAYSDKKLGRTALSISKEGRIEVVTLQENAPTQSGSDKGGEYKISFAADIAPSGGPNLNRVHKLAISEGTARPYDQLANGTFLEAQVTPDNARIAEVNYPFNVTTPTISEAAAHPQSNDELRLRVKWITAWDKLFNHLVTDAENQTATGPQTQMIFKEPADKQPLPF